MRTSLQEHQHFSFRYITNCIVLPPLHSHRDRQALNSGSTKQAVTIPLYCGSISLSYRKPSARTPGLVDTMGTYYLASGLYIDRSLQSLFNYSPLDLPNDIHLYHRYSNLKISELLSPPRFYRIITACFFWDDRFDINPFLSGQA